MGTSPGARIAGIIAAALLTAALAVPARAVAPPPDSERGPAGSYYTNAKRCPIDEFRGLRFVMMNAQDLWLGDSRYRDCITARFGRSGIGLVRENLFWDQIERRRNHYTWAATDEYVATLARANLRLAPYLLGTPRFRSSAPRRASRRKRGVYPPRRLSDMGRFAQRLVRRYGPDGSFWRAHPELPALPITTWQIWNEPNLRTYWPTGPDGRRYRRMLNAVGAAIRRADPQAEIVSAGLPYSRRGKNPEQFLAEMESGPGTSHFDAFAVNAYARTSADALGILRRMRRALDRGGHRDARLWVTEIGWPSSGPRAPVPRGMRYQATQLRRTLSTFFAARGPLKLDVLGLFSWRDLRPGPGQRDYWGLHLGLVTRAGRAKRALAGVERETRRIAASGG